MLKSSTSLSHYNQKTIHGKSSLKHDKQNITPTKGNSNNIAKSNDKGNNLLAFQRG